MGEIPQQFVSVTAEVLDTTGTQPLPIWPRWRLGGLWKFVTVLAFIWSSPQAAAAGRGAHLAAGAELPAEQQQQPQEQDEEDEQWDEPDEAPRWALCKRQQRHSWASTPCVGCAGREWGCRNREERLDHSSLRDGAAQLSLGTSLLVLTTKSAVQGELSNLPAHIQPSQGAVQHLASIPARAGSERH